MKPLTKNFFLLGICALGFYIGYKISNSFVCGWLSAVVTSLAIVIFDKKMPEKK